MTQSISRHSAIASPLSSRESTDLPEQDLPEQDLPEQVTFLEQVVIFPDGSVVWVPPISSVAAVEEQGDRLRSNACLPAEAAPSHRPSKQAVWVLGAIALLVLPVSWFPLWATARQIQQTAEILSNTCPLTRKDAVRK